MAFCSFRVTAKDNTMQEYSIYPETDGGRYIDKANGLVDWMAENSEKKISLRSRRFV